MCGIAGLMDLAGRRHAPEGVVERMSKALIHRGPDEEGFLHRPGLALASRRLAIVGLADGQQPVSNEDQSVFAVFNGELFDYPEKRAELTARGHRLHTHCDTEIIPHLWEESQEKMFERLRGQFAIALYDVKRHQLTLARDRFGISPLYWTRQGDWLLFASEIKGLLASGMVAPKADLKGLDQIFTFAAMPGPVTCFAGVQLLTQGHYLQITPTHAGSKEPVVSDQAYWTMDFPNQGDENPETDPRKLADALEALLLKAVEKRLRADVPVGAYLSGGLDSSMIVAMACKLKGEAINTYTIRVDDPALDELSAANRTAKYIGTKPPIVQDFKASDAPEIYPQLIQAAEAPVIDTSCAALLMLAKRVHSNGQKVVLTGEGADEWLAGYPWYKISKLMGALDIIPGLRLSNAAVRAYFRSKNVPIYPQGFRESLEQSVGGFRWPNYGFTGNRCARCSIKPARGPRSGSTSTAPNSGHLSTAGCGSARGSRWPDICSRPKATAWPCTRRSKRAIRSSTRTFSISPPSSTRAGNSRDSATNTCCDLSPNAGCRRKSRAATRSSSARPWTASTSIRNQKSSASC